jgi:hypothetical protein
MSNKLARSKLPTSILDAAEQQEADGLIAQILAAQQAQQELTQQLRGVMQFILRRKGLNPNDYELSWPNGKAQMVRRKSQGEVK